MLCSAGSLFNEFDLEDVMWLSIGILIIFFIGCVVIDAKTGGEK